MFTKEQLNYARQALEQVRRQARTRIQYMYDNKETIALKKKLNAILEKSRKAASGKERKIQEAYDTAYAELIFCNADDGAKELLKVVDKFKRAVGL